MKYALIGVFVKMLIAFIGYLFVRFHKLFKKEVLEKMKVKITVPYLVGFSNRNSRPTKEIFYKRPREPIRNSIRGEDLNTFKFKIS